MKYNVQIRYVSMFPKEIVIAWSSNIGFGQLTIREDKHGKVHIERENVSDEFLAEMFEALHRWTREQEDILTNGK